VITARGKMGGMARRRTASVTIPAPVTYTSDELAAEARARIAGDIAITYRLVVHAGHDLYGNGGHDLEEWDVTGQLARSARTGDPIPPVAVPCGAAYHSGYVDRAGVQHWIFTRRAPPSAGSCERCTS